MLKYFIRGRKGWWILHVLAISFMFWLGHTIRF
jgi:hypothetical protein